MKQFIRCTYDAAGDLPKSLIGRRGELVSRNEAHDDLGASGQRAWNVRFKGWKDTKVLWEDEFLFLEN